MESDSVCNHTSAKSDDREELVGFVNQEYDYRPTSDDTKATYSQLIMKIIIFEKHKK